MINSLSHMTFIVKDLDKSSTFFSYLFDAKEVYSSGEDSFSIAKEKFFLIKDLWVCIMEGSSLKERTYNHIALHIDEKDFQEYVNRIEALGLDIRVPRPRIEGEAKSIYFYDYDNHLFELHTGSLEERLKAYQK